MWIADRGFLRASFGPTCDDEIGQFWAVRRYWTAQTANPRPNSRSVLIRSAGLWTTVHNCTAACADSEQGVRIRKAKAGSWTMESKAAVSLGPEIEAQIAEIDGMTLEAIRKLIFDCMSALPEGRINARQGEALTCAAENRIRAIRKEHMAVARLVSEIARRQTQRMQWIAEAPIIYEAHEASLAPS
jgi:hypothetical protein